MFTNTYNFLKNKLNKFSDSKWKSKLDCLEKKALKLKEKSPTKPLRILMGPSFAIWPPSYALDRCLSLSFRIKGHEVIPIYCDSVQHLECNFYGGDWGGGKQFDANCKKCKIISEQIWENNPNKPIPLSRYLKKSDYDMINSSIQGLDFNCLLHYEQDGLIYGKLAKDILVNNFLVATPDLIDNFNELFISHLRNLLILGIAYKRILDNFQLDRVVSNDSYYGMWAILEHQCKIRSIPFYSHWPATSFRSAFAYNDAAMNLDFKSSWPNFSKIKLTIEDEIKIDKWLHGNRGLVIDTTKLSGHEIDDLVLNGIDINKPTIILTANVIWDLAALNKQIIFDNMMEWVVETAKWFDGKNNFQLIIKPHPAESSPLIPPTRETVASAFELGNINLPSNVFLLKSNTKITLHQILYRYRVFGFTVHTSTVGLECAARGYTVITTGKSPYRGFGFTIDPENKFDYFNKMKELLNGNIQIDKTAAQDLAKKFINFYQFHYYVQTGLFEENPPKFSENFVDIVVNNSGAYGHIIDSIIDGLPVNSHDRWTPGS